MQLIKQTRTTYNTNTCNLKYKDMQLIIQTDVTYNTTRTT